jgi:ABC-type polysaccharide/polyol phosphate transport system ATPase subunit
VHVNNNLQRGYAEICYSRNMQKRVSTPAFATDEAWETTEQTKINISPFCFAIMALLIKKEENNMQAIETFGLVKRYKQINAVEKLDLKIQQGELFCLLGVNGAGKTTTILMLLGLTEPTEGKALIDGFDCTRQSMQVKRITGYLPDNVGFYGDLTGRDNLRFTARLNGIPEKEIDPLINDLLERVGMMYAADQKTGTYSI